LPSDVNDDHAKEDKPPALHEAYEADNSEIKPIKFGKYSLLISILSLVLIFVFLVTIFDNADRDTKDIFSIISLIGVILYPITSIVLAIVSFARGEGKLLATTGIICSVIGGLLLFFSGHL